jgi:uncharacterized protein (TIGR00255 family)
MISSMTGFGQAEAQMEGVWFRVEVRSVNNRYFKATMKLPDHLQRFEGDIEKILRERLGRGSVTLSLRIRDMGGAIPASIHVPALRSFIKQLHEAGAGQAGVQIDLAGLLSIPGVCEPPEVSDDLLAKQWSAIEKLAREAITRLEEMRKVEGQALLTDLKAQCVEIRSRLKEVEKRRPSAVEEYHRRLHQRVAQLLEGASVELDQEVMAREVAVFAERSDVSEEISRLGSHLEQFDELCAGREDAGRKLEFVAQEMLREANTIGSKANDAQISRHVVEIKAAIDRIKEQVQNVG